MTDQATPAKVRLTDGLGPDEWTQAKLARMTLWLAYCWNDHNFQKRPDQYARECAVELGIAGFEDANDWLQGVKVENPRRTLPALPAAKVLASRTISGKRVELKGWHEDDLKAWAEKHGFAFGAQREFDNSLSKPQNVTAVCGPFERGVMGPVEKQDDS